MRYVYAVALIFLGGLFITSGTIKLKDPTQFAIAIRNYELIGDPWVAIAALFLPWLEIIAGICLVARKLVHGSAGLIWSSLIVFTIAVAISWARGLDIACGCFGLDGEKTNYPLKIFQNLILIGLATWIWIREAAARKTEVPVD